MDTDDTTTQQPTVLAERSTPAPVIRYTRVPWRRVGLFILIPYALFAAFAAPFWFLPGGISHPLFGLVIGVGMWSPAIASLIVAKTSERMSWRTRVGLRWRGRWGRLLLWTPLAAVLMMAILLATTAIAILRGVPGDLTARSWLRTGTEMLSDEAGQTISPIVFVLISILITVAGILVTVAFTMGEEIGWRGWLWPALKPLGTARAAMLGGVIWALWHLPIMLIGYNYAGAPRALAIPFFILPCAAMFLLLGALTDRALGSPVPAAMAHAVVNSFGVTAIGLFATSETMTHLIVFIDYPLGLICTVLIVLVGLVVMPRRDRSGIAELDPGAHRPAAQGARPALGRGGSHAVGAHARSMSGRPGRDEILIG